MSGCLRDEGILGIFLLSSPNGNNNAQRLAVPIWQNRLPWYLQYSVPFDLNSTNDWLNNSVKIHGSSVIENNLKNKMCKQQSNSIRGGGRVLRNTKKIQIF